MFSASRPLATDPSPKLTRYVNERHPHLPQHQWHPSRGCATPNRPRVRVGRMGLHWYPPGVQNAPLRFHPMISSLSQNVPAPPTRSRIVWGWPHPWPFQCPRQRIAYSVVLFCSILFLRLFHLLTEKGELLFRRQAILLESPDFYQPLRGRRQMLKLLLIGCLGCQHGRRNLVRKLRTCNLEIEG